MTTSALLLLILAIDLLALVVPLLLGMPPRKLAGETSPLTLISALQLLAAAVLSWRIRGLRRGASGPAGWKAPHRIWALMAAGFVYLALDELAQIHERLDELVHGLLRVGPTAVTDRLDDAIVAAYLVTAAGILYVYREELRRYRAALPLWAAGFLCAFLMTALDMLTNRADILKSITGEIDRARAIQQVLTLAEEELKVVAGGLFAAALHACLQLLRKSPPEHAAPR